MKNSQTSITTGGVYRCCLASIHKDGDKEVKVGDSAECEHCKEKFTLTKELVWKPDWQLRTTDV